jgi:predicted DNA-binding protein
MTPRKTTPQEPAEHLPRPTGELEDLASYYDTHDTSTEMEHGHWVDPRPMQTTSLRLSTEVVDALKARARRRGIRYTTLLREIIENAVHNEQTAKNEDLTQINDRLARIEAAITQRPI